MELLVTTGVIPWPDSGAGMCDFRDEAWNFLEGIAPDLDPRRARCSRHLRFLRKWIAALRRHDCRWQRFCFLLLCCFSLKGPHISE